MNDRLPGTTWDNPIWHRKWRIYIADPDAQHVGLVYEFCHNDYDGAPDANDHRYGHAKTIEEAKAEIDAIEEESTPEFHPARDPFAVSTVWATPEGDQRIAYLARVSNSKAQPDDPGEKLIGYLLRNHHWSPFEMANLCLEIRTQRDISAQILRHRSFSFQEFSTRYAEVEELLALTECRFQDHSNRQNSLTTADIANEMIADEIDSTVSYFDAVVNETRVRSLEAYQELLRRGIAKEVARRILPIGLMPTKIYMNGTVRSWLTYCMERTKPGVQKEHKLIALHALNELFQSFPMATSAAIDAGMFAMSEADREYFEALEPRRVEVDRNLAG